MQLVRSLLTAALGLTVLGTQVSAADFFVQPLRPGPVAGTPLSAISLQATTVDDAPNGDAMMSATANAPSAKSTATTTTTTTTTTNKGWVRKTPLYSVAAAKAKWLKARKRGQTTTTTGGSTGTTSGTTTTASADTGTGSTSGSTSGTGTGTTSGSTTGTTSGTPSGTTSGGTTGTTSGTTGGTTSGGTSTTGTGGTGPAPTTGTNFASFGALMSSGKVKGGDRIFLLGGYHGAMVVSGQQYTAPVVITSMPGQVAQVDGITVRSSKNVVFQGFKVWTSANANGLIAQVRSYGDTSDLVFRDLDVRAAVNSTSYAQWTITDWNNNKRSGFLIDGPRQTVARNRVTGIYNGILMVGTDALMEENIIDGFAGDGMRALGDNSIVRRNKVQNCHQINASHTDAFQAWTTGPGGVGTGTLRNLTIEDNKIFEFVGTRRALACKLQGISLFAGAYENFIIRNNVVSTTAYHGITINRGKNSQIINNTVIHAQGLAGRFPWISNGGSTNLTVANNMTTALKVANDPVKNVVETNNIVVTSAANEFTAHASQDFRLRSSSKGVNAGTASLAPKKDIDGTGRPLGKAPDAGAYESF